MSSRADGHDPAAGAVPEREASVSATPLSGRPGPDTRWRCSQCGNLTRFDVVLDRRSHEFWHFQLSGDLVVEDAEVAYEQVVRVACRWCGSAAVEVVSRPSG